MFWIILLLTFDDFTAADHKTNKYIDLLPEKEKQEFLETIARRIFNEIKSKSVPKDSHAVISDDQLDAQSAYVHGVIEEEAENLKNISDFSDRINYDSSNDTQNTENNKVLNSDNNHERKREKRTKIEVQPLDTTKTLLGKANPRIIPVKIVKDIETENESDTRQTAAKTMKTEKNQQTTEHSTVSKMKKDNSEQARRILPNDTDILVKHELNSTDDVNILSGSSLVSKYNDSSAILLSSTPKFRAKDDNYTYDDINEKTITSKQQLLKVDFNKSQSLSSQDKSVEINSTNLSVETKTSEKDMNHDTRFENKLNDITSTDPPIHNISSGSYAESATTIVENLKKSKDIKNVENKEANILLHLKSDKEVDNKETDLDNVAHNVTVVTNANNSKKSLDVDHVALKKIYEVYEIDPKKSPFLKSSKFKLKKEPEGVVEEPHYAPVYNYDPENAYFNPHNRFQLDTESVESVVNVVDKNERKILRNPFKSDKHSMFNSSPLDPLTYLINALKPQKAINLDSMPFKPIDYLDVDYYSGRAVESHSHDSNENIRYNTNNVRDRIREVRLNYFERLSSHAPLNKKVSGPLIYKIKLLKKSHVTPAPNVERHKDHKTPISLDYYFERSEQDKEYEDFEDIKPLTESPISKKLGKGSVKKKPKIASEILKFNYKSLLRIFRDMILLDNDALVNYDWLKSTVDIRAAVYKIIDLMKVFNYNKKIDSKDLELLKYIYYLYASSMMKIINEEQSSDGKISFDYPKPSKNRLSKAQRRHLVNKGTDLQSYEEYDEEVKFLFELEDFLKEVLFYLDDFHNKIKEIAQSATYKTQDWYNNIKRAYLKKSSDRQLGAVLLHLSLSRVFNLIDASAETANIGFKEFVKRHPKDVQKSKDELIFAIKVLRELQWK